MLGEATRQDRGALDAALECGFPCGGWCPEGRKAEDGPIGAVYPLTILPAAGYWQRSKQNIIDSDGTLVIHFGPLAGGSRRTARYCGQLAKPVCLVDGLAMDERATCYQVAAFLSGRGIETLNVAGPRESKHPGAAGYAKAVMSLLLSALRAQESAVWLTP